MGFRISIKIIFVELYLFLTLFGYTSFAEPYEITSITMNSTTKMLSWNLNKPVSNFSPVHFTVTVKWNNDIVEQILIYQTDHIFKNMSLCEVYEAYVNMWFNFENICSKYLKVGKHEYLMAPFNINYQVVLQYSNSTHNLVNVTWENDRSDYWCPIGESWVQWIDKGSYEILGSRFLKNKTHIQFYISICSIYTFTIMNIGENIQSKYITIEIVGFLDYGIPKLFPIESGGKGTKLVQFSASYEKQCKSLYTIVIENLYDNCIQEFQTNKTKINVTVALNRGFSTYIYRTIFLESEITFQTRQSSPVLFHTGACNESIFVNLLSYDGKFLHIHWEVPGELADNVERYILRLATNYTCVTTVDIHCMNCSENFKKNLFPGITQKVQEKYICAGMVTINLGLYKFGNRIFKHELELNLQPKEIVYYNLITVTPYEVESSQTGEVILTKKDSNVYVKLIVILFLVVILVFLIMLQIFICCLHYGCCSVKQIENRAAPNSRIQWLIRNFSSLERTTERHRTEKFPKIPETQEEYRKEDLYLRKSDKLKRNQRIYKEKKSKRKYRKKNHISKL